MVSPSNGSLINGATNALSSVRNSEKFLNLVLRVNMNKELGLPAHPHRSFVPLINSKLDFYLQGAHGKKLRINACQDASRPYSTCHCHFSYSSYDRTSNNLLRINRLFRRVRIFQDIALNTVIYKKHLTS